MVSSNDVNIRDDLFNFWHVELVKNANCSTQDYQSKRHTSGNEPKLDKCLEALDSNQEYLNLTKNFLTEYETCMNTLEDPKNELNKVRNLFNTHCLDAIAVRRLLIENKLCCSNNSNNNKTVETYSTVCDFNLKTEYHECKVIKLTENVLKHFSAKKVTLPTCSSSRLFDNYFIFFKYFTINFFYSNYYFLISIAIFYLFFM